MILPLYRGLSAAAGPLIEILLARRVAAGKEDPARLPERRGIASRPRPNGPLVWVHAASVGESFSALALIARLLRESPSIHVLMTTGTLTSAGLMAERLPERAFHQFAPLDRGAYVRRFLDHWQPDLALWVESEFWPNLLHEARARGIPIVLVNARISQRAFARWRLFRPLISGLLSAFSLCLAQDERQAGRLSALGARAVKTPGNLKYAAAPLPCDGREFAALSTVVGSRPRWLAASTHRGEEVIAAAVHSRLLARHPGLLTVIVPRHPGRGRDIGALLRSRGLATALRSANERPGPETHAYIADRMGELGLFYRLCPIAFVGGSLVPHGGHNLLEPAQLGCAVLHGPHVGNFREIADDLAAAGASLPVADEAALADAVDALLADPSRVRALGEKARAIAAAEASVLERVMAELDPYLAPFTRAGPRHARA